MIKDTATYRILIIEDNPGDLLLVSELLKEQISDPVLQTAENFEEATAILSANNSFDTILLDLRLPDKSMAELVTATLALSSPNCPVIILSGYADLAFSIKSIAEGVLDYLLKDELNASVLYKSIIYSIGRKKSIKSLNDSTKQYSDLFQLSPQPMCLYEPDTFRFLKVNKAAMDLYGYSNEEFLNMTLLALSPVNENKKAIENINRERILNQTYTGKFKNFTKNGNVIEVETSSTPILVDDKLCTLLIAIDVTEKNIFETRLTKAIIKTQEDERYEIGGELHDNICQLLATCLMTLGMLKEELSPGKMVYFEQCKKYMQITLEEIRNLSHRLAPAFFDGSTLEEAFQRLLDSFNLENKYNTNLEFNTLFQKLSISQEIQLNLYRILQEQLRNIVKYSRAKEIKVKVDLENDTLDMKIIDDGIGFDPLKVKGGIGLANIRRRTELFSGLLDIKSAPGNGCELHVEIPLPHSNK